MGRLRAHYGIGGIPESWVSRLALRGLIMESVIGCLGATASTPAIFKGTIRAPVSAI